SEAVFTPLGLKNTLYYMDRFAVLPKRATGYSRQGNRPYKINTATLDVIGDGGVFTTLDDLTRWIRVLENPQGNYAHAVEAMRTRVKLASGDFAEYGRGLMLKHYRGLDIVSHVGGLRGYRSEILWIPSEHLGVVCLCNTSEAPVGQMARRVADAVLGKPPAREFAKVTPADLARKSGVFRDRDTGDLLFLAPTDTNLAAQYQGFQMMLAPETP